MNPKLFSILALSALFANAPDVPPLPPAADEERDRWFRPPVRPPAPTDADRAAMQRAEAKRERKNAARMKRLARADAGAVSR